MLTTYKCVPSSVIVIVAVVSPTSGIQVVNIAVKDSSNSSMLSFVIEMFTQITVSSSLNSRVSLMPV